jgi:hypothetical protein
VLLLSCLSLWSLPAFPGAEGYGSQNLGGRGGKVIFVTNTNASGAGSLQAALFTTGPRIIIFRTSGVINLTGEMYMEADNLSYCTVAGQTSPGGITIKCASGTPIFQYTSCKLHDIVWRHLRFRPNTSGNDHAFEQYLSYNWVIDHCDFSGGSDECLDICRVHDITLQWSTVCNSQPGGQVYGILSAYNPLYDISFHHNLWANHVNRFPEMHWESQAAPNNGNVDMRNNIAYNGQNYFFFVGQATPVASCRLNLVSNYYKAGPNSPTDDWLYHMISLDQLITGYEKDNLTVRGTNIDRVAISGRVPNKVTAEWPMAAVTTDSAVGAYTKVLDKVGAWPRDPMNTRTVNEVRTSTGQLGKVDDANITTGPAAPTDTDNDGMPDCWETAMGFNPNDSAGKNADHDGDGYTNVEEYINDLALCRVGETPQNIPINLTTLCPTEVERAYRILNTPRLSISPNPCVAGRSVAISLNKPGQGVVRIFGADGKLVRSLPADASTSWNGKDDRGAAVAAGLYLINWQDGGKLMDQKFLVYTR